MAKDPSKEIEFHPDAMERFERAVKVIAQSPPQHRVAKKRRGVGEPTPRSRSRQKINKNRNGPKASG